MAVGALVHDHLVSAASRTPHRAALSVPLDPDEREPGVVTFTELDVASDRLAAALQAVGLGRGDRVVIMGDSTAEVAVAIWAVLKAGGVFVVVDPTTKHDKLAYQLDDCGACALVAPRKVVDVVRQALVTAPRVATVVWMGGRPENGESAPGGRFHLDFDTLVHGGVERGPAKPVDPGLIDEDLAGLVYTAGSSGRPKAVMLTHRTVVHNAWSICRCLSLRHDDVVACLLPLSFDYGLFQLFTAARAGCTVALEQASTDLSADVLGRLAHARVSVLPGVPSTFVSLLRLVPFPEGVDLATVRMLTNSGAPLAPTHIRNLRGLFPTAQIYSMYGLDECTRVTYLHPDRLADKISSVGKVMPNTEAYVVDDLGRRVAPGVVGELVVRGTGVMHGYWGKPDDTAAGLREGDIPGQTVLYTGDQFWADDEGFLYYVGRHDDMFTCQGQKVSPREVETVVYELESVAEVGVVGVPDEVDGMAIKVVVAPRGGLTVEADDIRDHCRRRLEQRLVPRYVEVRETLPKTASGKIRKAGLLQT